MTTPATAKPDGPPFALTNRDGDYVFTTAARHELGLLDEELDLRAFDGDRVSQAIMVDPGFDVDRESQAVVVDLGSEPIEVSDLVIEQGVHQRVRAVWEDGTPAEGVELTLRLSQRHSPGEDFRPAERAFLPADPRPGLSLLLVKI